MISIIKNLKISQKLPLTIVGMILVYALISSSLTLLETKKDMHDSIEQKLVSLSHSRKSALENYLSSIEEDLSSLSRNEYVRQALLDFDKAWDELGGNQTKTLQRLYIDENPNPTGSKEELDYATDGSVYSMHHKRYHSWFRHFLRQRDYYDIFLFDVDGNLVYTVFKELDYATNINTGEWKDSDLGNAFRAARDTPEIDAQYFFDFKPYAPSHGAAASFISQAILDESGKFKGVLVFQMPIARINKVMQVSAGLGKSGETYIVGEDYLMRSDSRFSEESTILKTKVDSPSVKKALNGNDGVELVYDYRGIEVVSAYTPMKFKNTNFAILAEIDESEAMESINALIVKIILEATILLGIMIVIAIFVSKKISTPIVKISESMESLAEGNNDLEIPYMDRKDEIGDMAATVQIFKENALEKEKLEQEQKIAEQKAEEGKKKAMQDLAQKFENEVQGMINSVAAAATELSQTAESMGGNINDVSEKARSASDSSQSTAQNVNTVASASEEMSSSVKEISSQIAQSTAVVNDAVEKAGRAETSAQSLQNASTEIGSVVELIRDIAEQINLLALNATIESARAGEAGKGFAVVASEVKNLASQTTKATEQISTQIGDMQNISTEVSGSLTTIKEAIDKVNEYAGGISASAQQQEAATSEIANSMQTAAKGSQDVNENVAQITDSANHANESAGQMLEASVMLSRESEQLSAAVSNFLQEIRNS